MRHSIAWGVGRSYSAVGTGARQIQRGYRGNGGPHLTRKLAASTGTTCAHTSSMISACSPTRASALLLRPRPSNPNQIGKPTAPNLHSARYVRVRHKNAAIACGWGSTSNAVTFTLLLVTPTDYLCTRASRNPKRWRRCSASWCRKHQHLHSQRQAAVLKIQGELCPVRERACDRPWQLLHEENAMHILSRLRQRHC